MKDVLIKKTINNNTTGDLFFGDVLLFNLTNLDELGLVGDVHALISKRQKNDMPSVITFGVNDKAMREAVEYKGFHRVIVSDHLTVIGNDSSALLIGLNDGNYNLIRTEINVDIFGNFKGLKVFAEVNSYLKPGEQKVLGEVCIKQVANANKAIREWATGKGVGLNIKTKPCPSVFCTWYYYGMTVNFADCLMNLDKIKEFSLSFNVFQIDDGWEKSVGNWTTNDKFPSLAEVSKKIQEYGMTPGVWTSPFVASKDAPVWKTHPNWLLRNKHQKPCIFHVNDTNYYIFDITIPETWEYFKKLYSDLYKLGFKYHKLDFTRAPLTAKNPNYANKHLTPVECYRNAFKCIREGMADSFLLVCGGLYDPLIGIADAARTGRDVNSIYTAFKKTKTLPYTIRQSMLRYYMNYFWYNDPDSLMLRKNAKPERGGHLSLGLLTDDEAELSSVAQVFGGGLISSTERLDTISPDRLAYYYRILPRKDVETEVVDVLSSPYYPNKIRVTNKENGNIYLVCTNLSDKDITMNVPIEDIVGSDFNFDGKKCKVCEFFSRMLYENIAEGSVINIGKIKKHSCAILKFIKDDADCYKEFKFYFE